jgi:hypothetical protein
MPDCEPMRARLEPLPDKGLAHDHFRIPGTGRLVRAPKQSQLGLTAADNLAYQAACFERASASGHAPRLHAVLPPSPEWPLGALVVDEIDGRPLELPRNLAPLAAALAAIHGLPVPLPSARPPLRDQADPLGETLAEVERQAAHLGAAGLEPPARAMIEAELAWARAFVRTDARPPVCLISFDAHPGNFLLDRSGRAVLVDLEKARYGSPGFDLAHASLYTSTTWDVACYAELSAAEVARLYACWLERAPRPLAQTMRPWLAPQRRLMWLWSITWCAKWRVESARASRQDRAQGASAEDWSAELSDPALIAHVKGRVDHYLMPSTIARVRADWQAGGPLTALLGDPV